MATRRIESGSVLGSFGAVVPPVLVREQRRRRCIVCLSPTDSKPIYETEQYIVRVCSETCRNQPWVDGEVRAVDRALRDVPMIFPTALLVYRLRDSNLQKYHSYMDTSSEDVQTHQLAVAMTLSALKVDCNVVDILRRAWANLFSIPDVANALFQTPSHYINHSCVPNAVQEYEIRAGRAPKLVIRAQKDISFGEEISIAYTDLEDDSERRSFLKESYGFDCDCPRCS